MPSLAPLKLIFITPTDQIAHVAFYDFFGGIPEVISTEGQPPELIIAPINKYLAGPHEVITLWVKPEEKEQIGQAIRDMFDRHDPMAMIFSGKLISQEDERLTDTRFCVEALRAALPILPNVPATCVTVQKLYTVLKMMGGI